MKVIGLTGGIASGKSTVSRYLKELGAYIIDADIIAREIVKPGKPAYREIVSCFGKEILRPDGEIDRARLGSMVFADPVARERLNQITHPRVKEAMEQELAQCKARGVRIAVLDVPLLYEAGMDKMADEVWVVWLPEPVQIERLISRDGLDEEAARMRVISQMPLDEKKKRGDVIIDNSGDLDDTYRQVIKYYSHLDT